MHFFTGLSSKTTNFAAQSFNSLKKVSNLKDYKVFLNDLVKYKLVGGKGKKMIIKAWEKFEGGALFKDPDIINLIKKYGIDKGYNFRYKTVKDFLKETDDWFDDIFKNNLQ